MVERELGSGGMATVYLAEDLKHNRRVAIKVLRPELGHAFATERFIREIRTTAGLRHPHILPLFDSGRVDELLYFVMPYAEGETLRDRLKRETQLPVDDALEITREVSSALSHANERGIIHRDIKPENILLEGGHAVVADFGIAHAIDAAAGAQLTRTGLFIGTPAYMSPEQAMADVEPDSRTDQYALACVLFEMLAGQPLFSGASAAAVMRQHLAAEPPALSALRSAVPPEVVAAVAKALAKDPAERFRDLKEFRHALRAAGTSLGTDREPRRWYRPRARTVGIAAGFIAVVGIMATALVRWGGQAPATDQASVAVLPFADLSPDQADAYLGSGIAETLANALANVPGLSVAAPATGSARGAVESPAAIGRALGVATVLDGSVQRSEGRLRVIARLVSTSDGRSVWSRNFDSGAEDIFALQDSVASAVAEALDRRVLGTTAGTGTRDLEAYDAYLQGRFFWKKRSVPDLMQAVAYFSQAIARDSTYARAWAGLADTWLMLPFYSDTILSTGTVPRASQAARHALSLDPELAEAHTSLAYALSVYDWDWVTAEREFQRALQLDPGYPVAHKWYSDLLSVLDRKDEALAEGLRAAELDPRSPNARTIVALREWQLGRTDDTRADLERALAIDPTFPLALRHAAGFYSSIGDTANFFEVRERLDAVSGKASVPVTALRAAMAAGGRDSVLRLQAHAPGARSTPTDRARWYAQAGDLDAAFAALDQAMEERTVWLGLVLRHPDLAPLHDDPRYAAILRKMALPL